MERFNKKTKELSEQVLARIRSGEVAMRPRWHFVLKALLAAVGMFILVLALLYLVSFVLFSLRATGALFMPAFGFRGMGVFLASAPWLLILAAGIFFVLLEVLVKKYSFAYRTPALYTVVAILVFVALGSFAVERLGFHGRMQRFVMERHMPLAEPFYRGFAEERHPGVTPGVVATTTENGFVMTTPRGEEVAVSITPDTRLPYGFDFAEGDDVVVLGPRENGSISAEGVQRISDIHERPMRMKMRLAPPPPSGF